ncbi:MAG: cation diffusion facilitator family transporter [Pseudomonadota bacterium]|nr:cation diffusion facilitator family transporter [Pseudomonadota bacterium]
MHPHDHPHDHPQAHAGRALGLSLLATLGFAGVEALAGWWAGSLALLGDAGHMVSDAAALGLAALAARFAQRPPSSRHSYGLGRIEVLAALVNGLLMLAVVAGIVSAAIQRLHTPQEVHGGLVSVVAAAGLMLNIAIALLLSREEQTLNTRGALLHVIGDLLGSVAALLAGAVIVLTGWTPIDPILSLAICLLILLSSLRLLREALHVIMEGVPLHLSLDEVGRAMATVARVRSVHDLHIWTLSSGRVALSAHVVIDDLDHWEALLHALNDLLRSRFAIDHTTLQPESVGGLAQRPDLVCQGGGGAPCAGGP